MPPSRPGRAKDTGPLAIVLSGGGARGAYELGILRHVLGELVPKLGPEAIPRILSGTSVGAINACCLAALAAAPGMGIEMIIERWEQLRLDDVFKLGWGDLAGVMRWMLGSKSAGPTSLLNAAPLADLVRSLVPWRALHENVQSGRLRGVTVSATDVESGHTVVFIESELPTPPQTDPAMDWMSCRLTPRHALASAAIPIVFPTMKIAGRVYSDGGLRQNTPLAPALRLGASRVMVVSLRAAKPDRASLGAQSEADRDELSRPIFLFGKLLDALLLDRVESDLNNLRRVNKALLSLEKVGEKIAGNEDLALTLALAGGGLRPVSDVLLRPSVDLGRLAVEVMLRPNVRGRLDGPAGFFMRHLAESSERDNDPSDLLSYLCFDGEYAHELIALGQQDARAREEELARFLTGRLGISEEMPATD